MTKEVYDEEKQLQLALREKTTSLEELLHTQMELFHSQIERLESLVATQCSLTAVNPLSQEMAAGALSIKIGKRPRDLLNPKAVNYMQSIFSVKDAITKRETREISVHLGITITQVREFFNAQRTRVRKYVRLAQEKGPESNSSEQKVEGDPMNTDPSIPFYLLPLNSVEPTRVAESTCATAPVEVTPGLDDSEKNFQENIFSEMRKEETIGGQIKLMEWILRIENPSLLLWFLTNGCVMILATWLSEAASEEQTTVLHTILKVLCHLPLQKALPVHMSAILQSVNKLRFYKKSDISNRARNLLSKWSKMFARVQALRKPSSLKTSHDAENEMLLKQSINEIMGDESRETNLSLPGDSSFESSEQFRKLEATQPLKLLTASPDDSTKKLIGGGSSFQMKGRRKVMMVEHPGQKPAGRSSQPARPASVNQSRPMSADDIQKAKLRAQYMQNKNGKPQPSQARPVISPPKAHIEPGVEKQKDSVVSLPPKAPIQQGASPSAKTNLDLEAPLWKKCRRVQIKWKTPPEINIPEDWNVASGEDSTEVEAQKSRNRRQKEAIYRTKQEIPSDPNEPWDREMEYDDSLTPEIPIEQLPDNENEEEEEETPTPQPEPTPATSAPPSGDFAEPDPELLAELLRHPELVFALQSGGLSGEEMVKLLDMIKTNGVAAALGLVNGGFIGRRADENVAVSLPSPTPSSNPVTSQNWRTDGGYNPFSSQERETMSTVTQQQQILQSVQALPQQANPQYMLHSSNIPNLHPANQFIQSQSPAWAQNPGYVNATQISVTNVAQERYLTQPVQAQSRFVPEQSWVQNPPQYMQPHHQSSFNGYARQVPQPYGERNEVGFESWSPENSPMRQGAWGNPNQRVNTNANQNQNVGQYNNHNYRPEYEQQSSRHWNGSGSSSSSKRHRR